MLTSKTKNKVIWRILEKRFVQIKLQGDISDHCYLECSFFVFKVSAATIAFCAGPPIVNLQSLLITINAKYLKLLSRRMEFRIQHGYLLHEYATAFECLAYLFDEGLFLFYFVSTKDQSLIQRDIYVEMAIREQLSLPTHKWSLF